MWCLHSSFFSKEGLGKTKKSSLNNTRALINKYYLNQTALRGSIPKKVICKNSFSNKKAVLLSRS